MYTRILDIPADQSFFLFGPRGTGKTAWLRERFPGAPRFDLLDSAVYTELLAAPRRIEDRIPADCSGWVLIDEVQRVPELLNEAHRLIEARGLKFVLTGSSARKLRARGVNLLAGRALTRHLHPLTAAELGGDFELRRALDFGTLPFACTTERPRDYLAAYVSTYLREEVQQEGLTRNLAAFGRFLEAASFSQGSVLNISAVARECGMQRKLVEAWFGVVEDLLIAVRVPVFARRARRRVVAHPKFYYFDAGVFRAIRPRGPLDSASEADGAALETLVLQHLRAANDYGSLGYGIHYWRTAAGDEVDFVLYGERGMRAFEVKASERLREGDFRALHRLREDYPEAKAYLLHPGTRRWHERGVEVVPLAEALPVLAEFL